MAKDSSIYNKTEFTPNELIKRFIVFLKDENAYQEYFKALKNSKKGQFVTWGHYINPFTIPTLKFCFDSSPFSKEHISSLISYAFCWKYTPQGHIFWSNLHSKWVSLSYNFKIINKEPCISKKDNDF